jgi:hypothetical protein
MSDTPGDHGLADLTDVPYEIKKWLFQYQIISGCIDRLNGELERMISTERESRVGQD